MSDFSYTQRCPYCGQRFAPDDGYCTCQGAEDAWYEEHDADEDEDEDQLRERGDFHV